MLKQLEARTLLLLGMIFQGSFVSAHLSDEKLESFLDEEVELIGGPGYFAKKIDAKNQVPENDVKGIKMDAKLDKKKDHYLRWTGDFSNTGSSTAYTALLNKSVPDQTNWVRSNLSLKMDYGMGKEHFGHDAVLVHGTFKHKSYWGAPAVKVSKEKISVLGTDIGGHTHTQQRPPLWVESAWLDYSLDAFSGLKSEGLHRCKAGFFSFELGRGIALGDSFGVSQSFLGVLIEESDYKMPGMLFYGSLPNKMMDYKFYLARPEARSTSEGQVLGLNKQHIIGSSSPFGGAWQDDVLLAAQLDFKFGAKKSEDEKVKGLAVDKDVKKCSAVLSPYVLSFYAPAKKVDIDPDSKVNLYTFGLASEFTVRNFSCGFDLAMNRGSQNVLKIDRNTLEMAKDDLDGKLVQRFSHIVQSTVGATGADVPSEISAIASKEMISALTNNLHRDGQAFSLNGVRYISKNDRIRNAYKNSYKGYMGVFDAELKFDLGVAFAVTAGYASGDKNPHKDEVDKDYAGFIGINETYSSKRVPSLIILGGSVKRPLTLDEGKEAKLKDYVGSSLTDIAFVGGGVSVAPNCFKEYKAKARANVLGFWKEYPGHKVITVVDPVTQESSVTFSAEKAGNYLGTEFNVSASVEFLEDLAFSIKFAVFNPGSYYRDIKGALLDNEITKRLAKRDVDQIKSQADIKYSMSNDRCYIFGADLKYTF